MIELVRRGFFLGLGALDLSRERAETLVNELVRRGELKHQERKGTIDELLRGAERAEERLRKAVEQAVAALGLPTKADLARLEERLAALEKKIK
ncbi:TPA: polyhydroxyalkanoate synthesis regulator [Candidatus Bipolaricaulota bacterium]|nr:polyhydroxyalkanoate synthesis regulator [Candidatus Bipolaricaulota bacterium]